MNHDLIELNREDNAAGWVQSTYITEDTQYLNSRVTDRYLEYFSRKAERGHGLRKGDSSIPRPRARCS